MKKLLFLLLFAAPFAIAQVDHLRAIYNVVPIAGGTGAGATGWEHTGITLATTANTCNSGGTISGPGTNGRYALTTNNATYDGCNFTVPVTISGTGITLKRSRIVTNGGIAECGDGNPGIRVTAGPTLIQDVEITTEDPDAVGGDGGTRLDRTICVATDSGVTIRRLWAHESMRGMDVTGFANVTIVDSYHGPNVSPPTGEPPGSCVNDNERAHASGVRAAGGTSNFTSINTTWHIGACSRASGIFAFYPENGANHDVLVRGGRWIIEGQNSGAYGIAVGCTNPESENYNFKVQNVQVSTVYNAGGCPSGCSPSWDELAYTPTSAANDWSNVTEYNPGQPGHGDAITASTPAGGTPGTCP